MRYAPNIIEYSNNYGEKTVSTSTCVCRVYICGFRLGGRVQQYYDRSFYEKLIPQNKFTNRQSCITKSKILHFAWLDKLISHCFLTIKTLQLQFIVPPCEDFSRISIELLQAITTPARIEPKTPLNMFLSAHMLSVRDGRGTDVKLQGYRASRGR